MKDKWLIVSDLDGTLLGDRAALARFQSWLRQNRRHVWLTYATGRSLTSVRRLLIEQDLSVPDFLIAAVGSELLEFESSELLTPWNYIVQKHWDSHLVRRALAAFSELELQDDECQSPRKVSYLLHNARPRQLLEIEIALTSAGMEVELIYSSGRFLDVLPKGINKGTAARFLALKLDVPRRQVVACGDSGNDLPLFYEGFCGVVVANALPELSQFVANSAYRSPWSFADGVLDGVKHWTCRQQAAGPHRMTL